VKIRIDSASGGKVVDLDLSTMEDSRLASYASSGMTEAREELKKRRGFDIYKDLLELTDEDVKNYMEWLKNSDPDKYNKIVKSSKDVE
jgi:hypothetical protein